MSDRDLSKLPRWASQLIEKLEADVTYWQERATAGPDESNTFVDTYSTQKPLGMSPLLRFDLNDGKQIFVRLEGDYIEVRSDGSNAVAVQPANSNTVRISGQGWW